MDERGVQDQRLIDQCGFTPDSSPSLSLVKNKECAYTPTSPWIFDLNFVVFSNTIADPAYMLHPLSKPSAILTADRCRPFNSTPEAEIAVHRQSRPAVEGCLVILVSS